MLSKTLLEKESLHHISYNIEPHLQENYHPSMETACRAPLGDGLDWHDAFERIPDSGHAPVEHLPLD